jgi:3-oxoacyl-[acyl-carrier-protein] synthase II
MTPRIILVTGGNGGLGQAIARNFLNENAESTKASIGHTLGAAGSIEVVICLMALRENFLPPTATLETPDPLCQFPIVQKPTAASFEYALTNSFGFGGANATLILRRWL